MIRRRIFPESRNRSFFAAIALMFVLVALLLAAGCSGDCPQVLHTATLTKLDSNGNITWTKVLDTGISNRISCLVPTSDGGFITAGSVATTHSYCTLNNQARLIRFTSTGEILWDRVFTNGERDIKEIIRMQDGGFAALIDGSEIYRLDSDGRTVWNRSTGYVSLYGIRSVITKSSDGGLVVAGPVFIKYDREGNILWKRSNSNENTRDIFSIIELKGTRGYFVFSRENMGEIHKMEFDVEGKFINSSVITPESDLMGHYVFVVPDGYQLLYSNEKQGLMMMYLDPEGVMINKLKINVSYPTSLTSDLGYFFVDKMGNRVQAVKLNSNGTPSWNNTIPQANLRNLIIMQVIQTNDGGFVIASDNGVEKDVSMLK
jgi:hypothetical protein